MVTCLPPKSGSGEEGGSQEKGRVVWVRVWSDGEGLARDGGLADSHDILLLPITSCLAKKADFTQPMPT